MTWLLIRVASNYNKNLILALFMASYVSFSYSTFVAGIVVELFYIGVGEDVVRDLEKVELVDVCWGWIGNLI